METGKALGQGGGSTHARRCGPTGRAKEKTPSGSAQVLDKARFGQRRIQASPLIGFGRAWLGLAQFGPIGIRLDFPWMLFLSHLRHGPHAEFATGDVDPPPAKASAAPGD
jgi:hypothetical protein